ncbi:MAG: branched-chain amino acid ABC transporter permease [Actinomycetota bacterium]|nr:branched-chain amino acid ABC transporter permease [Actinomycetota bacterium]
MLLDASITSLAQHVVDALALGSTYALYALGVALVFSVMRLINFAHGELITAGALGFYLFAGMPLAPLLLVTAGLVIGLALLTERVAFRPVRNADPATLLITSFALSYLLQSLLNLFFGSAPKSVNIAGGLTGSFNLAGVSIGGLDALTIVVTALLLTGMALFFAKSTIGIQMRAAAEDFSMARLVGVRANRVIATAFAMSGLLAAIASFFLIVRSGSVTTTIGVAPLLIAFIATVVGGMGSLTGAVVGGMLMGIVTVLFQVILPPELGPYRDAFVYFIVLTVLVFRPRGLIVARSTSTRI